MNKEQLFYFVKIIDCGSINKASEELYVTQPTLSRAIQSLEKEVGKELIVRTNKGISITPSGKTMYYYAQSIVGQFQMLERLKSLPDEQVYSNLSVSVSGVFLSDSLVLDYYNQIHEAETEVNFYETTIEGVLNNLIKRKSELGIVVLNDTQYAILHKMCEIKNIEIEMLGESPLYVHANQKVFAKTQTIINAKSLLDKTYIHIPKDFYSNLNASIEVDTVRVNSFKKTITTSNYHTMINMIKNNQGFLLGSKWQVDELKKTKIKSYLIENCKVKKYFLLLHNKKEQTSTAVEIFVKLLKEFYGKM